MKKSAKFFTALTCVTLASGLVFPALGKVYADPDPGYDYTTTVEDFKVAGFDSTYVIGEDEGAIIIPAIVDGVSATMTIYDPSNKKIANGISTSYSLTPTKVGDYRVVYYLEVGGNNVKLGEKVISVTKAGFYFEFPSNTSRIIPTEMNLTISDKISGQGFNGTIALPYPDVYASKTENKVEDAIVAISVKKPAGSSATVQGTTEYTFKPDVVGEYIFTYSYSAGGTVVLQKQFVVDVNNTYNNEYELNYEFTATKPTTAIIGVETTLPGVKGTNKETGESVAVHYDISITKNGVDKSAMLVGDKFKPTEAGDYVVSYTIKNAFGTSADSFSFTIKDVADTKDPEVYFGYLDGEEIVDMSSSVPTKSALYNVVLPAIYAKDNSGSTVTYKREVYKVKTYTLDEGTIGSDASKKPIIMNYFYDAENLSDPKNFADQAHINNYIIYNYYDDLLNTDADKKAFTSGTYTVSYTAIDASKYDTTKSYTMQLLDTFTSSTPEIVFETILPSEVKLGEEISFDIPTAKDDNDERMLVKTYYRFGATGDWVLLEDEKETGKYTIKATTAGTLNIKVEAINDEGIMNSAFNKSITILDINEANDPTYVGSDYSGSNINLTNDQFSEIILPAFTFNDENLAYLSAVINVSDKDGKAVSVYDKKTEIIAEGLKVSGAKFKASKSGQYTVSYVLTDISGNTFVYSFQTNSVRNTVAPTIVNSIFDTTSQDLEIGESLILPIPSVKDGDGVVVNNPTYSINVVSAEGDYEPIVSNRFKPLEVGKYVIQYVVQDAIDPLLTTSSALYTINVVNTVAPTITNDFDEFVTLNKNASLSIPQMNVTTNGVGDVDWENTKVEVFFGGSVYKTLTLDEDYATETARNEAYSYTFTKDGVYTIKYTATDLLGNISTKSFDIKVGDTVKPVLKIDDDVDFSDRLVGTKLVIDPGKITVSDAVDTDINIFDDLVVTVKNSSTSTAISNNYDNDDRVEGYEFNLDEVGTYEVTFTLKDAAGNVTSVVKEFTVSAEEADKKFPTEVVGIILLVVACLVLGGVIAYFVITRKKVKSPEQLKRFNDKKDKKNKKSK